MSGCFYTWYTGDRFHFLNEDNQWSSLIEQNCPFPIPAVSPSVLYKQFIYAGSVTKLSIPFLWSICLYLHLYYIIVIIIILYKVLLLERPSLSTVLFKARLQSIWKLVFCWLFFTDKIQPLIISVKTREWFTSATNLHRSRKGFNFQLSFPDIRQHHQRTEG